LRVDADLHVEITDDSGARMKGLPAARAGDDPDKVKESRAAFDLLKNELETAFKVHAARLELALSSGRRWFRGDWDAHLREQPLMKHLIRRLVWGAYDDSNTLELAFILDEQLEPMGVDLGPAKIKSDRIGLIHPVELDPKTRDLWVNVLSDFEIIQPFPQLGRAAKSAPKDAEALVDFPRVPIPPGPLHGVLNRLGWVKGDPDDMIVSHFYKDYVGFGVRGVIELDPGLWVTGHDDKPQNVVKGYFTSFRKEPVPLKSVPPVPISEVLTDLDALASAAQG